MLDFQENVIRASVHPTQSPRKIASTQAEFLRDVEEAVLANRDKLRKLLQKVRAVCVRVCILCCVFAFPLCSPLSSFSRNILSFSVDSTLPIPQVVRAIEEGETQLTVNVESLSDDEEDRLRRTT